MAKRLYARLMSFLFMSYATPSIFQGSWLVRLGLAAVAMFKQTNNTLAATEVVREYLWLEESQDAASRDKAFQKKQGSLDLCGCVFPTNASPLAQQPEEMRRLPAILFQLEISSSGEFSRFVGSTITEVVVLLL
jgi:hypothetical protein